MNGKRGVLSAMKEKDKRNKNPEQIKKKREPSR